MTGCEECSRPYGDIHGFPDLIIPDYYWELIMPNREGGGLLCPNCIIKRLMDKGIVENVPFVWQSGPFYMNPRA